MATILRWTSALVLGAAMARGVQASTAMETAVRDSAWASATAASANSDESLVEPSSVDVPSGELQNPARLVCDGDVAAASCDSSSDQACDCSCNDCAGCGKSICDCGAACCDPPLWFASAGAVILHRDRPGPGTIIAANPAGTRFSGADDFDFGWDGGPDVALGRRLGGGMIVDGRYFHVDSTAAHTFRSPGAFIGVGFTGPANTLFQGRYLTKLDSSEINLRGQVSDRLSLLAGFRWVELKDEMIYRINGNVATGDYEFNNRLYGGQLGASLDLSPAQLSRVLLNVEGKAGVFGNVADGGIFEFSGNNPIGSFKDRDTTTAFVGEVDITAGYRLTPHVVLRGGYQLLWLDNLALAGEAASRSLLNPSLLRSLGDTGSLFYNGATTGIDFVW